MSYRFSLRASFLLVSAVLSGTAALQFALELPRSDIPSLWIANYYFLLGVFLAASVGVVCFKPVRTRLVLLLLQLGVLVLVGIPEGRSLAVESVLGSLLLLEILLLLEQRRWRLVFAGLVVALLLAVQDTRITFVFPIEHPGPTALLTFAAILALVYLLGFFVSRLAGELAGQRELVDRLNTTVTRLTDANVGFQRYAKAVEGESVDNERKRISREIHDTIGYTITTLIMLMEAASDLADGDRSQLKTLLNQGIDQAISSLDEIRRSLRELRAMEVPQMHGLRAIKKMIQAFQDATHIRVDVDFSNVVWDFDEETNEVFYRMIQESLANAFRHGGATKVTVTFSQNDREVRVSIRDNGKGTTEIHDGIGLSGMRERIGRLNGTISAQGVVDGFLLSAAVPLAEAEVGDGA